MHDPVMTTVVSHSDTVIAGTAISVAWIGVSNHDAAICRSVVNDAATRGDVVDRLTISHGRIAVSGVTIAIAIRRSRIGVAS
jgi:hypothetical protein